MAVIYLDCGAWSICWGSAGILRLYRIAADSAVLWQRQYSEAMHLNN